MCRALPIKQPPDPNYPAGVLAAIILAAMHVALTGSALASAGGPAAAPQADDGKALRVIHKTPGLYRRGWRITYAPKSDSWVPPTAENHAVAAEGHPKWFPLLLADPHAVEVFAHSVAADGSSATLPTSPEFVGALRAYNRHAQQLGGELILTSFRDVQGFGQATGNLRSFARRAELPTGRLTHDGPYHYFSIFMPDAIMQLARRQTAALLGFEAFLGGSFPHLYRDPDVQHRLRAMVRRRESSTDVGTGNLVVYALNSEQGQDRTASIRDESLHPIDRAERAQLMEWVKRLCSDSGISTEQFVHGMATVGINTDVKALERERARQQLERDSTRLLETFVDGGASPASYLARQVRERFRRSTQSPIHGALDAFLQAKRAVPGFETDVAVDPSTFFAEVWSKVGRVVETASSMPPPRRISHRAHLEMP